MFIHWETLRYAAFTFLGALSLLAALMAMFYTTASDTLGLYNLLVLCSPPSPQKPVSRYASV